MRLIRAVLTFLVMWVIAWLAGYDFDTRHAMVAYWFSLSVIASIAAFALSVP
jgi:hypothetical protein